MQKTLQTFGTALTLLVGVIAVFALGAFLPKILPVNDWFGGWYTFRVVTSGSMEPAISTGSLVATWPTGDYAVGDVVTFGDIRAGGDLTTHRIVQVVEHEGETVYATKGDANEERDFQSVAHSDIVGEVFLSVPYAGYFSAYASTSQGSLLLGIFLVFFFAGWFGIDFYRKKKKENLEKSTETQKQENE